MSLRKFILYSTIGSLFSEAFYWQAGIDIRASYFLIIFNLLILAAFHKLAVSRTLLFVYLYLAGSAWLGVSRGTASPGKAAQQWLGIAIISFYYYNFYRLEKKDVDGLFRLYVKASFIVCVIGLLDSGYRLVFLHQVVPVKSIFFEAAHFALVVLPAFYYLAHNIRVSATFKIGLAVVFLAIILSGSSVGFIGIFLSAFLLTPKSRWLPILLSVLAGLVFILSVYTLSEKFQVRLQDTAGALQSGTVAGTNLSTYALLSNAYVTRRVIETNPVFGNGLGSHELSYRKYISELPGLQALGLVLELNFNDADSLFLRVVSEEGALGIVLVLYFIFKLRVKGRSEEGHISNAILIYFLLKLLRDGHQFPPEFYFFVFAYFFNYFNYWHKERRGEPVPGPTLAYPGGLVNPLTPLPGSAN